MSLPLGVVLTKLWLSATAASGACNPAFETKWECLGTFDTEQSGVSNVGYTTTETPTACFQECLNTPACDSVTWGPGYNGCHLRTISAAVSGSIAPLVRDWQDTLRFDPACRPASVDVAPYPCRGAGPAAPSGDCTAAYETAWECNGSYDAGQQVGVTNKGYVVAPTAEECFDACLADASCDTATFGRTYNGCHLRSIAAAHQATITPVPIDWGQDTFRFDPACRPSAAPVYDCLHPTPVPVPEDCTNEWKCGVVYNDGDAGVSVPANGFLSAITDPTACLKECVSRNTGGSVVCNAVSLPIEWYQGCHLWKLGAGAVAASNANYRSIAFDPACVQNAAMADEVCYPCDGANCAPGPTPTPTPTPGGGVKVMPPTVNFEQVAVDGSASKSLNIMNTGNGAVNLTAIECTATAGGAYITILLPDGTSIPCESAGALTPAVPLPVGSLTVTLKFEPLDVTELDVSVAFKSGSDALGFVTASGTGGDPFSLQHTLHPVIEVESLYLIPTYEPGTYVYLQAQESHTHGPKDYLVGWTWKDVTTGQQKATTVNYGAMFDIGTHTYELKITDNNGATATATATFMVASEADVEGTYVRAYNSPSVATLPALPDFATVTKTAFSVSSADYKGFEGSFVLRLSGKIAPEQAFVPNFAVVPVAGAAGVVKATKIFLDGAAPGSSQLAGGQEYELDVRVKITAPMGLRVELNGLPITFSKVDVSQEPPIINDVVSGLSAAAGSSGALEGFLVRAPASIKVGGVTAAIVQQSDKSIQFTYPEGLPRGPADIVITRDGLTSNVVTAVVQDFTQAGAQGGPYTSVPTFTQKEAETADGNAKHTADSVDRVVWCNGHLFAASAYQGGLIFHYTCDEDWNCKYVDQKQVAAAPYQSILGLACDPWENDANTKLWFSHNHLYAQGGTYPEQFAEYKGRISYVEWFKPGKPVTLVVKNLAVSNHDHAVNDLGFLHDGDLLITTASNTNAGFVSGPLGYLPENPTTTGVWRVKVRESGFYGALQYQWLRNAPADYVANKDPMDQRYGEWAQLVPNPHFSLFTGGVRNPFGLDVRSKGEVLMTENGPNYDYGMTLTGVSAGCDKPAAQRGPEDCKEQSGPDPAASDTVRLSIQEGDYYGTPNPARCREWLTTGIGNPDECKFTNPNDIPANPPACPSTRTGPDGCTLGKPDIILESSLGGPFEYISHAFGGAYSGQIFIPSLQSSSWRYNAASGVAVQDSQDPNYPFSPGVDAQQGPGGVHLFASFSTQSVKINVPVDATAEAALGGHGNPSLYDMAPMKSAVGLTGKQFIIGGINFQNMSGVTVKFGSLAAVTPSSVGNKWIKGDLPTGYTMTGDAATDCHIDVTVSFTDTRTDTSKTLTMPGMFCWLPAKPSACSNCIA